MGKALLVLLLAIVGWVLLKGLLKGSKPGQRERQGDKPPVSEKMIQCQRCGVFMPESESMSVDGKLSCRQPDACPHRQRA
jgi:hypothetical protein